MFDVTDYQRGAAALRAPTIHLMAVAAIEAAGENFWTLGNKRVPAIRPEAHWFSRQTKPRGKYNTSHPRISSPSWRPELAAKSKAEAWRQFEEMAELDPVAAAEATSWGPFQIMGFHWKALDYPSVQSFVDDVDGPEDDGQMDMFVRFVKADHRLLKAIQEGDWDTWEEIYNGGGYGGAYAAKIRAWIASQGGATEPRVGPRVLRRGLQGEDVKRLQEALGVEADGNFGPATESAVRTAQAQHSLVVDGVVGVMTLRALGLAV